MHLVHHFVCTDIVRFSCNFQERIFELVLPSARMRVSSYILNTLPSHIAFLTSLQVFSAWIWTVLTCLCLSFFLNCAVVFFHNPCSSFATLDANLLDLCSAPCGDAEDSGLLAGAFLVQLWHWLMS